MLPSRRHARLRLWLGAGLLAVAACAEPVTMGPRAAPNAAPPSSAPAAPADERTARASLPFRRPLVDSWEGIHPFLVFDGRVDYGPAGEYARHRYDFVWGAGRVVEARRGRGQEALLGGYVPANRDPRGHTPTFDHRDHTLAWYLAHHPDWIVYRCPGGVEPKDQASALPAYYFDEDKLHLVPIDIANPEVAAWQVASHGKHARAAAGADGYDVLGVDNLYLTNVHGMCGVFQNGRFVRRYHPEVPDEPAYCADVVAWTGRLAAGLHALAPPVRLVGNLAPIDGVAPACRDAVIANLDGVLDEGAFMRPDARTPLPEPSWLARLTLMKRVQDSGRAYYALTEYAATPRAPDPCAPVVSPEQIQWALASYLMGKGRSAAIFVSALQQYGCPLWYPEFDADVGHPCGEMRRAGGVWARDYSRGLVLANASPASWTITLPPGAPLVDVRGVPAGATRHLPPHSGLVLVSPAGAPPRCR